MKRDELDNPDRIQYIMLLLGTGANPNVQNQAGKTLLHYVAERNDIDDIRYFLGVIKANPSIRDQSGRTPFEYVTEPDCLQALKYWGYNLDDSHENEGNPTTPNGSVDDCSNSSGDDSQIESVKLSDCNTEEDSSCSSSDYLFLEDSLLARLEIPLTTDERGLIGEFCEEIRGITAQNKQESEESILESIEKIVNKYLEKGLRLNSSCSNDNEKGDKETVTNLILEEIEGVVNDRVKPRDETREYRGGVNDITDQDDDSKDKASGIIGNITKGLLLKGGKARQKFFFGNTDLAQDYGSNYVNNLSKECEEIESKLISIACEGIVNKSKQTHEYDFKAEIDNVYFYVKYSQDSIINPAKIFNKAEALKDKALNLKVGILQIGESIVRVESIDGKRNYKDILKGSIKMSFTTEVGEISIYLHPSKEGSNKIEVEIDDESEARLNKLKAEKKSLGESCLLGGKNVLEAIENKDFKKNGNVSTEPTETIKDVPFTDFTQACSQQIDTSVKGR
ncbi:MAG: ankyrin repeat domain-containing protein [Wolbachia endosymbiont of Polyergus mexicanus]|uniref:Ankyrin repeat domain-containing protein n=1 Tax=Wolbachia endosymbiont of Polyergus mexicanus TaxID=3171167 RepID=A0AAU7YLF5_9RICK